MKIALLLALFACHGCYAQMVPTLVKDITPGALGTEFMRSAVFKGKLVFTTQSHTGGAGESQLWISDGTATGTSLLGRFDDNYSPHGMVVLGEKLFFIAADTIVGHELRCTDGTAAGTKVVKDIRPGKINGLGSTPVALFNKLYFVADGGAHVAEIWESDGTEAGTRLFNYIDPPFGMGCNISGPIVVNNRLFFTAWYGGDHMDLWTSDTTAFSAAKVAEIDGDRIDNRFAAGNKLYFIVSKTDTAWHTTYNFCVSDGTSSGTYTLTSGMVRIYDYAEMGGKLFFYGLTTSGSGIWCTDGTTAGTRLVKGGIGGDRCDVYQPGAISLTVFRDKLYFGCSGSVPYSNELWVSDGTTAGTHAIASFSAPMLVGGGIQPRQLTVTHDALYFKAWDDSTETVNLWRTDGTSANTTKIFKQGDRRKITNQICAPVSSLVELVDSTIFFVAEYDSFQTGTELYKVAAYRNDVIDSNTAQPDSLINYFAFYPNPSSGDLYINVAFDKPTFYSFGITCTDGKDIKQLAQNGFADVGKHKLQYRLHDLPAGVYFVRFFTDRFNIVEKVVLLH